MTKSQAVEHQANKQDVFQLISTLLDALDRAVVVADTQGRVLCANPQAQHKLSIQNPQSNSDLNLFSDLLHADRAGIMNQLEGGAQEVILPFDSGAERNRVRIRWLPEPDWLVVYLEGFEAEIPADEAEMRNTVQELMQEREITYRNLLAAYLRLQEVNRQKTVFLASAAHELKTPLAVMKGYYDLLLTGSLEIGRAHV